MKYSKFNVLFDYEDKSYITNTVTKAVVELDDIHREIINEGSISKLTEEERLYLSQNGILVDDDLDEIGLLRFRANQSKDSKEEMEFVIAPTMACNLRCTYCFETPREGFMSEETQEKVFKFIIEKTDCIENKRIHLIWFGGEPLLFPEIVLNLNQRIWEYCNDKGKQLQSDIITNGYLLTSNLIRRLGDCHINHLQITLDGPKESHDLRRVKKDGSGTYDRIFYNLKQLSGSPITVSLRINVDRRNIQQLSLLEYEIASLNNPNIHCAPALVEVSDKHFGDIKNVCYFDEEAMQEYYNNPIIEKYHNAENASEYGIRTFFCEAEHYHSFALDELGNVYKCWNSLGIDKDIFFTLDDEEANPNIISSFFARDPFTESDCIDCPYIPICAGGCLVQKRLHGGKNYCSDSKYNYLKAVQHEIDKV